MTEPTPVQGIDLLHYASVDDWDKVRASDVEFVSITTTESNNWTDPAAPRHVTAAQQAGIHTGIRHYARPGAVQDQAAHFVRTGAKLAAFAPRSLAPALHVEAEGVDDRFIKSWIKAMRNAAGIQRVLVYASHSHWERRLKPNRWADDDVVLWLTRHNGIPGRPGWFHARLGVHQHSSDAGVPGVRGQAGHDALVYPFTLADLLL